MKKLSIIFGLLFFITLGLTFWANAGHGPLPFPIGGIIFDHLYDESAGDGLLLETGDALLLETGDKLLLE